jgi:ATP-binding cassette subfamily F protein uup
LNYLTLEKVSKSFGEKTLFSDINLTIAKGQKIALIAKNGTGKTTLLRVIAQEEAPEGEHARILLSKEIRVGYLKQDPDLDLNANVLEAALDSDNAQVQAIKKLEVATLLNRESEIQAAVEEVDNLKAWDIEARIKEILGKLKVHNFDQKVDTLSGGQKKRLALAKILIEEPDFLILDEPTNHLDLDMIEWLEEYLGRQNLTLFMVTHDRYFLERVCNEIVELDDSQIYTYRGNYSDYLEKKANRVANEKANLEKTKKLYKKELDWVRRQPQARGTKAKSRVDKFYEIEDKAKKRVADDEVAMRIDMARLGGKILEAHNVGKSFDDLCIVKNFTYKFKKGERVGLAGPNGAGKTTFIKLLTKEIKPDTGKVVVGDTVVFGHYTQSNDTLNEDVRVIDCIREIAEFIPLEKGKKLTAESLLEKFLFPRSHQQVYVSQLSGGEKRRLLLLRILMKNPNFLILDEPTNDLDILTLNVLENFLQSYKGCLLVISHDRFFMDKLVDHLFVMTGKGNIKDFNGTYSEFKQSQRGGSSGSSSGSSTKSTPADTTPSASSAPEEAVRKLSYKEKMEYAQIEQDLAKMEKRKKEIEALFMDSTLAGDKITELSQELGQIQKDIDEREERWLELAEYM